MGELRDLSSDDQAELQRLVESRLGALSESLQNLLQEKLSALAAHFQTEYIGSMIELSGDGIVEVADISSPLMDQVSEKVGGAVKLMMMPNREYVKLAEAAIKTLGQKIGGKVGKGLAKNASKIMGPVVVVLSAAYEIFRAKKAQAEYERQERARTEAFDCMVTRLRSDVRSETMRSVKEVVDEFFGDLSGELDKVEKALSLKHSSANKILAELRLTQEKLCALRLI